MTQIKNPLFFLCLSLHDEVILFINLLIWVGGPHLLTITPQKCRFLLFLFSLFFFLCRGRRRDGWRDPLPRCCADYKQRLWERLISIIWSQPSQPESGVNDSRGPGLCRIRNECFLSSLSRSLSLPFLQ